MWDVGDGLDSFRYWLRRQPFMGETSIAVINSFCSKLKGKKKSAPHTLFEILDLGVSMG